MQNQNFKNEVLSPVKTTLFFTMFLMCGVSVTVANVTVCFLPFKDNVKLKEAWDLSVDIPRWFTQTIDTIDEPDSAILTTPFDTVVSLIKANAWNRDEYLQPQIMKKIGSRFALDYIVTGTVKTFQVMKRSVMTDADFGSSHQVLDKAVGQGGATVMGGLEDYSARVEIFVEVFSVVTATKILDFTLDSEHKDGGLSIWLPFQIDNAEINFDYMSRSPFGSVYFHRSIIGAVMNAFSSRMRKKILDLKPQPDVVSVSAERFIEGKVLERTGRDVYLNLGHDDKILVGENLEILKPGHPICSEKGDTLGWTETPAGSITVRSIKAAHFSVGVITDEKDSIISGWTVRSKVQ